MTVMSGFVGLVFVGLVAGLYVARKRLQSRLELEEAERTLAAELEQHPWEKSR